MGTVIRRRKLLNLQKSFVYWNSLLVALHSQNPAGKLRVNKHQPLLSQSEECSKPPVLILNTLWDVVLFFLSSLILTMSSSAWLHLVVRCFFPVTVIYYPQHLIVSWQRHSCSSWQKRHELPAVCAVVMFLFLFWHPWARLLEVLQKSPHYPNVGKTDGKIWSTEWRKKIQYNKDLKLFVKKQNKKKQNSSHTVKLYTGCGYNSKIEKAWCTQMQVKSPSHVTRWLQVKTEKRTASSKG